jgi:hypothetical protein
MFILDPNDDDDEGIPTFANKIFANKTFASGEIPLNFRQ